MEITTNLHLTEIAAANIEKCDSQRKSGHYWNAATASNEKGVFSGRSYTKARQRDRIQFSRRNWL